MYYDNEEGIGGEEFNNILKQQLSFRASVMEHIKNNRDGKTKYVGDIVQLWDTSRLTDYETNEFVTDPLDVQLITKYPSVVIEENQKYCADIKFGFDEERVYHCNLDIVIWNKVLGKKFRTSSDFVKLTDKKL